MSDHLDGYTARSQPTLDIADVYLFPGRTGVVFVMNVNPLSGTGGFHHECTYTMCIDRTGDAVPDMALRVTFGDPDTSGRQPVELRMSLGKAAACDPADPGRLLISGRTSANLTGGGFRLFAGPAADPFYIDPTMVTAVKTAVTTGTRLDLSGFDPSAAHNLFASTNVHTIVVEAPIAVFGLGTRIGYWGTTWVPLDDASGWRQIDRAANPLVSTLFGQDDPYNAAQPTNDVTTYRAAIRDMTAAAVAANGTSSDPLTYGALVADALLPDILTYRIGTAAYWYAQRARNRAFARNGRDLIGNHANEAFRLVLNMPNLDDGLTAADASGTLRSNFPYLSVPV